MTLQPTVYLEGRKSAVDFLQGLRHFGFNKRGKKCRSDLHAWKQKLWKKKFSEYLTEKLQYNSPVLLQQFDDKLKRRPMWDDCRISSKTVFDLLSDLLF